MSQDGRTDAEGMMLADTIEPPAFDAQGFRNLAMAAPTVLLGQPQNIFAQDRPPVLEGAAGQTDRPTGPSFRRREHLARIDNGLTKLVGCEALGFR
jgi:hypothetical protein